jgi:DNA-binding HxlR family transcriptional regulator
MLLASQMGNMWSMASVELAGALLERNDRPLGDYCPIDRAMQLLGHRTTMLILREAFYGETRFDGFARRAGITEAVAAKRLKELVAAGLMERSPYQEQGQRTRFEYVLTEKGRALLPVLIALLRWGNEYVEPGRWSTMDLSHVTCGAPVSVEPRCANGHVVAEEELRVSSERARRR